MFLFQLLTPDITVTEGWVNPVTIDLQLTVPILCLTRGPCELILGTFTLPEQVTYRGCHSTKPQAIVYENGDCQLVIKGNESCS